MKKHVKIFIYIIITGIAFLGYTYFESRWLKLTEIGISSPDLPRCFDNTRLVFITDIHHGPFLSIERVRDLVDRINSLQPDIVLLGGDYVHGDSEYIVPLFTEFRKLKATYGVYGVLGNHDHWEDKELTRQMMGKAGIRVCDNKSFWVTRGSSRIKIGGVGDLWEDVQILSETTSDLKESDFAILLTHSPDFIEELKGNMIDLTLAGHTHGGQVTFFGLWAPILPSRYGEKYRYGLKKKGKMYHYTSSGVGTITPPVRFFCRPEIVLITLRSRPYPQVL